MSYIDPSGLCPGCLVAAFPYIVEGIAFVGSAAITSQFINDFINVFVKPPDNAYDTSGPKAPGRPSNEDGFECPKTGDNWVQNPNGDGWGWEAKDGSVWVPTGKGGTAHGGPHWDVQFPKGGYKNVRTKR